MRAINLEQQRSVRQILAATAGLYRLYPVLFVTLAVAVMGPYDLAVLAVTGYGPLRHSGESIGMYWLPIGIAVDTIVASFVALTLALLYFDLRARPDVAERAAREYQHLRDLDE
jgi:hypothetical protein